VEKWPAVDGLLIREIREKNFSLSPKISLQKPDP
jgi:hypothetical protein